MTPDVTGERKPATTNFLYALSDRPAPARPRPRWSGDSLRRDIEPANRLGLLSVHAAYGDWNPGYDCTPDHRLDAIAALPPIVLEQPKSFSSTAPSPLLMPPPEGVIREQKIAYFTMECGILSQIPTYAGGLGILAGDIIRSSADLRLPLVGVTLASRHGYFRQEIDEEGRQTEPPFEWDPGEADGGGGAAGHGPYRRTGRPGPRLAVRPAEPDRGAGPARTSSTPTWRAMRPPTARSPGPARRERPPAPFRPGVRARVRRRPDARGPRLPDPEAPYERGALRPARPRVPRHHGMDVEEVRERCVFTTHTPIARRATTASRIPSSTTWSRTRRSGRSSGRDRRRDGVEHDSARAQPLGRYVNGVAKSHGAVSTRMFRGNTIHAITNGVHSFTWTAPSFRQLFDRYLPGWANEPESPGPAADRIPNVARLAGAPGGQALAAWNTNRLTGSRLCDETLTLGYARRFTPCKSPDPSLLGPRAAQEGLRLREGPDRDGRQGLSHGRGGQGARGRGPPAPRGVRRARSRLPSSPTTTWTSRPGSWPASTSG